MRSKLIQSVLVICMLLPTLSFAATKWLDKVIALVESDVILDSEFKRRLVTIKKQLAKNGTELPPEDAINKQVLERLVMDQIQLQKAANAGVRISDADLNSALNRIAESNNTTLSSMKAQIESEGLNFALFREDIRQEMIIARYRQGAVSRTVFVSEQEVDDVLALMNERGASSINYRLRHLMVAIAESAGPDEIDSANAKVASIVERYKAGEVFSSLVVAESDGSDAINGGDLGWKTIEQLPTLFSKSVATLEKGQLTAPLRSANGLHLLMLEEKKGDEGKQLVDEVNYRHILIKVTQVMTIEKAKAQLLSIRREILADEADFEEQAKVYSEDLATATGGGDLGWAPPEAFKSLYLGKVDDLKNGELSEVFEGANGWYLVEQLGTRTTDQTKEMKRMKARRILQNRKYTEEQETWLREIREQAYVKIIHEQ
jgi:peptidyl-prolyl cis-trans isomerase SurA